MKKKISFVAAALAISAIAGLNVKTVLNANNSFDLTTASIEAMSENTDGGGSEYDPSEGDPLEVCINHKGTWNMVLLVYPEAESTLTCETEGLLFINGIQVSGSFKKGKKYRYFYHKAKCTNANGLCCIPSEQGTYINRVNTNPEP